MIRNLLAMFHVKQLLYIRIKNPGAGSASGKEGRDRGQDDFRGI